MQVILNKEQKSWITRNFYKIASATSDAKTKRNTNAIAEKCNTGKDSVKLTKLEATSVLQAVKVGLKALSAAKARYVNEPEKFADYLTKIPKTEYMLEGIKDKLERKLK